MKLRWRLVLALVLAGLLPLLPMLWVVHTSVSLSANSLAPTEIGQALASGVELTRALLISRQEKLARELKDLAGVIPSPLDDGDNVSHSLDSSKALHVHSTGDWHRWTGSGWRYGSPDEAQDTGFRGFPERIFVEERIGGLLWRLDADIEPDLIEQAKRLQSTRADWTMRSLGRDSLIWSLVLTYGLTYLGAVLLAVFAALLVVVPESRRIERLADVMESVGEGDTDRRADIQGGGEVGQLAESFNLMIERLETSRKKAADMEKMAGWRELARVLAHEIKNPLTPIQLSVQQITDSYAGDDEKFGRLLATTREIVDEEIDSLRKLVREFSDFARAPQLELAPYSPHELASDLGAFYGSRVELVIDSGDFECLLDREKLKRALINLLDNALHAAGESGRVRMSLSEREEDFVFHVEDSGEGVPQDRREAIFEPYVTGKKSGVGLGLPVVKSVAEEHGGTVVLDDSPELGGARFRLTIPRKIKSDEPS